jgi:Ankyrin repeats (3 copies)
MPGNDNSKTQIIVAAIAAIGVLGAAIFSNLDKFTGAKPEKKPETPPSVTSSPPPINTNVNVSPVINNNNTPIINVITKETDERNDQLLTTCVKSGMPGISDEYLDTTIHDNRSLWVSLVGAASTGNIACAEALLKAGASPNTVSPVLGESTSDQTPLLAAVQSNNLNMVKLLIDSGADINLRGLAFGQKDRASPLAASAARDEEISDLLIAHGADVNAPNSDNATALVRAVMVGKTNLVAKLLQKGADKNVVESITHEKPIEIAKEKGYTEIVKVLE